MPAPATENTKNAMMIQSATLIVQRSAFNDRFNDRRSSFNDPNARGLNLQLASRQLTIRPEVLFARPQRHFLRESWRGRLFVPANFFEVVPYILLVVGILRLARLITVGRPEARGIRCEHFIRQCDALGGLSKFKLGVGNDDAALPRIIRGFLVDPQRDVAKLAA